MPDGPKRRISSDTHPISIPPSLLERFRRDSERPKATDDDLRRALADAVPNAVQCPGCMGLGKTSEARASVIADAIAEAQSVTTCPLRQAPPPNIDDDDEPTQR